MHNLFIVHSKDIVSDATMNAQAWSTFFTSFKSHRCPTCVYWVEWGVDVGDGAHCRIAGPDQRPGQRAAYKQRRGCCCELVPRVRLAAIRRAEVPKIYGNAATCVQHVDVVGVV